MRLSLAPLRGKRVRFAAKFSSVSPRGNIVLEDVMGPGGIERHMWIPFDRWTGKIMLPETKFNFSARVGAYTRLDGEWDFGLLDIEIEGVQR
jgi:hypothetical protein